MKCMDVPMLVDGSFPAPVTTSMSRSASFAQNCSCTRGVVTATVEMPSWLAVLACRSRVYERRVLVLAVRGGAKSSIDRAFFIALYH